MVAEGLLKRKKGTQFKGSIHDHCVTQIFVHRQNNDGIRECSLRCLSIFSFFLFVFLLAF